VHDAAKRPQKGCLAKTRNAFQQDVPTGQKANEDAIHHLMLANNYLPDLPPDTVQAGNRTLQFGFRHDSNVTAGRETPIALTFTGHRDGISKVYGAASLAHVVAIPGWNFDHDVASDNSLTTQTGMKR